MSSKPVPSHTTMSTRCPRCHATLIIVRCDDGTIVPLDVRPMATYQLVIHEGVARATPSPAYVDHMAICAGKAVVS